MDNNRRLIIRVSRSSLAFSTAGDGGEIVYEPYPLRSSISMAANLREALRSEQVLQQDYGRVTVMVDSAVMMMPAEEWREAEQDALYRYTVTGQEQQAVVHTVLPDLNAVAVFAIHRDLLTVLRDRFGQSLRLMPAVAPVWRHLHQRSYTGPRQKLYGYFHDQRLEVFSFGQNRFRFCNAFPVQNADNALYYLLAVWKQLGLVPEQDELHLVGELPDAERLLEETRRFVKRVYHILPSGEFNRAQVTQIPGMPYDLMTLYVKGR